MKTRPIHKSLREYGLGLAGGLLFSLPLFYTMEVWYHGFFAKPVHLAGVLILLFVLLLCYNRYSGLRRDHNWKEVVIDSIEEIGLGMLLSTIMLLLLAQINETTSFSEVLGKIIIQTFSAAIGISIGSSQFAGSDSNDDDSGTDQAEEEEMRYPVTAQAVMALLGAVALAASVAPTEEVLNIATTASYWNIIGLVILSISVSAIIVLESFKVHKERDGIDCTRSDKLQTVVMTYGMSIVASALVLWVYGQFYDISLLISVREVLVLSLIAVIGGSAGRFLLAP